MKDDETDLETETEEVVETERDTERDGISVPDELLDEVWLRVSCRVAD